MSRLVLAVVLCCPVAPCQRTPVPAPADLEAARGALHRDLVAMLVQTRGGEGIELLRRRGEGEKDPCRAYALLQSAREGCLALGDLERAEQVIRSIATRFEVDEAGLREATLTEFGRHGTVSPLVLVYAWLDHAERTLHSREGLSLETSLAAATRLARGIGEPALIGAVEVRGTRLRTRRSVWRELAGAGADAPQGPALGRYLCFHAGDWEAGLKLLKPEEALERNALRTKTDPSGGHRDCVSIAETWLTRAREYDATREDLALVQRNLWQHAMHWYRRAWPQCPDAERQRLIRAMGRLEDLLMAGVGPGRIRFGGKGLAQMVVSGGPSRVENGLFVFRNVGETSRATCRYAFRSIRSVTIRGGIRAPGELNFRFAVGRFNALLNWEVQPENHFFLDGKRSATKPRLLRSGVEHEFRLRQLGEEIVLFCDDQVVFRGHAKLSGTVCVYPAVGSEIFVREILIDGDVDPRVEVTGPVGQTW